jgi:hypothetical protein
MFANLANFVLDKVLMFQLGWGMAGCGWASVISQVRVASHLHLNLCDSLWRCVGRCTSGDGCLTVS